MIKTLPASSRHQVVVATILAAWIGVLGGCTVKFVSSYDEQTDKDVTALQRKVESFFVRLERADGTPKCTYEHHKTFYDETKVDISGIQVRSTAIPQNAITNQSVLLLSDSFEKLEELHKRKSKKEPQKNCFSKEEIQPLRESFNTSFTAILKFELAKKRGEAK